MELTIQWHSEGAVELAKPNKLSIAAFNSHYCIVRTLLYNKSFFIIIKLISCINNVHKMNNLATWIDEIRLNAKNIPSLSYFI